MLGFLSALTPFSIDLYLPAFPQISRAFDTSLARVGFSVSSYFIGYALGQLMYGPLLDRFGRKPPLYFGLTLYVLASLACMSSTSVEQLIFCRVFQAVGGCVAGVAAVAMVKDFFAPAEGAKIFSLLMLVLSVSPLLAPTMGSFLTINWGWEATFAALAGMGALLVTMVFFFLPEGHEPDPSVTLSPSAIWKSFQLVLHDRQFFTYAIAGAFSFSGLFVYITGSPAIFMDGFQVSPQVYSLIFAFLAIGMIGGGQINLLLTRRWSSEVLFRRALQAQVAIGAIFLVGVWWDVYGVGPTIGLLFALISCCGITYPNAAALAMEPFSKNAGTASALLGFLQLGIGAVISACVGLLEVKGALPTASVMFFSASVGLAILTRRTRQSQSVTN